MEQVHTQDSRQGSAGYQPIEDYAAIGDLHTVALVGKKTAPLIGPTGEALGNHPQAFTHLSLIPACCNIDKALNRSAGMALDTYQAPYP